MSQTPAIWCPSVLRWAGSKKQLVRTLLLRCPRTFTRYIEPFAGSACLFFALKPTKAILGDINEALLDTYNVIRDHPRLVARTAASWKATKSEYYRLRGLAPNNLPPIVRAARFVYLNRYCFNAVYRTNRQGQFNVPRGIRTGMLPGEREFYRCAVALRGADLRYGDFANCLKDIRAGDFVYLDPPYASKQRPRYGEYGYNCFADGDVPRLMDHLQAIDESSATFLLSYSYSKAVSKLLSRWHVRRVTARRHVAGFASHRARVREILVSNQPFLKQ